MKFFEDITEKEFSLIGGKAKSLCFLIKNKINVSDGFMIREKSLKKKEKSEILEMFDKLNTDFVAVRSSANMEDSDLSSFAGIFQTFLYVDKKNLISKVKECFECINVERVKQYCNGKNIDFDKLKISVVVQKMVNSEVSGVCFTKHPVTKNENQVVIEACYGLGEALVSGLITPDLYVCDKLNKKIVQQEINEQAEMIVLDKAKSGTKIVKVSENLKSKQKLSEKQIMEIFQIALKIEKLYGKAMDIEWAYERGVLYILQARAITV